MNSEKKYMIALGPNPAWQKTLFFSKLRFAKVNRAYDMQLFPSGKGVNFCRAAKNWEKIPSLLMQFAGGDTGKRICEMLDDEPLEHCTVQTHTATRTCVTCLCRDTQEMTELIEPSHCIEKTEIVEYHRILEDKIKNCSGVAFCGTLPNGTDMVVYSHAAEIVKQAGLPLLVDSWQDIEPVLKIGGKMIFKVNSEELQSVTGVNNTTDAIKTALERYPLQAVAITDGPGNAYFASGSAIWTYKLPRLENIISPLGCGDTAAAVFFSEYLSGTDPVEAFACGLAAASANCLTAMCGSFALEQAEKIKSDIVITEQSF
jgi:fructose-1-phosphate kinase PfkB-like protein